MVQKLPTIEFTWNWIKDKKMYFEKIPYTYNYHLIVVDEDEDICGMWILEKVERYERE
jgi:hypothetical protein